MKLSKQERIGVLIIAVIVILCIGIFMFLVPKFEEMGRTAEALESKKNEYQSVLDKAAMKDTLKDQVIEAYETGRDAADMFFEEMEPYEADAAAREFIKYCQDNGINMVVESLSVSEPTVMNLSVAFTDENPEITYALKEYATQGKVASEDELAAAARRLILLEQLSGSQSVAASTVTFNYTVLDEGDYLKFVDIVNNYQKEENGKVIRKALATTGLDVTFEEITEKYDDLMNEMKVEIEKKANEQIVKNGGEASESSSETGEEEDKEAKPTIKDSMETYTASITFYGIERMLDPTEQLEAQDAA